MTSRLSELVTESERARLDLQMLFGVHVYSRAKVVPDLALSRGEDAHRAAKLQGDRSIEFLAAGGVALSLLELGDVEGAERWIGLAAAAAAMARTRAVTITCTCSSVRPEPITPRCPPVPQTTRTTLAPPAPGSPKLRSRTTASAAAAPAPVKKLLARLASRSA